MKPNYGYAAFHVLPGPVPKGLLPGTVRINLFASSVYRCPCGFDSPSLPQARAHARRCEERTS